MTRKNKNDSYKSLRLHCDGYYLQCEYRGEYDPIVDKWFCKSAGVQTHLKRMCPHCIETRRKYYPIKRRKPEKIKRLTPFCITEEGKTIRAFDNVNEFIAYLKNNPRAKWKVYGNDNLIIAAKKIAEIQKENQINNEEI